MNNLLIYDWLAFTIKEFSLDDIKSVLGLNDVAWEVKTGVRGYQFRQFYENITLHYGGEFHEEIHVEMSGQGCRAYETYGRNNWDELFSFIGEYAHNVGRIDVAFDDHTGILDIDEIYWDAHKENYISKARAFDFRFTSKGKTIYIGSFQSPTQICIYDKAKERLDTSGEHWIRVELRLRDERAARFASLSGTIGEKFCGVMLNFLRFVEPDNSDTNKWRWPLKSYWADMLGEANAISLYETPGIEYNLLRCENYVYGQSGSGIFTLISIYGVEHFLKKLEEQKPKVLNDKYKMLISKYKE